MSTSPTKSIIRKAIRGVFGSGLKIAAPSLSSTDASDLSDSSSSAPPSPINGHVPRTFDQMKESGPLVTRSRVGPDSMLGRTASKTLQSLESLSSTTSETQWATAEQTVLVVDWDDTLCPSHVIKTSQPYLNYFKPCPDDPKYKVPLGRLSSAVIKFLRLASQFGKVIILTNAQPGWVQVSCRNFLPGVWSVICDLEIDVVYAREYSPEYISSRYGSSVVNGTNYEYDYNRDICQQWKERAMFDHLAKFYSKYSKQSWKNLISIGDQICEHNAIRYAAENRPTPDRECRTKTLKLLEAPTIDCLSNEVNMMYKYLKGLVLYNGDISLDMRTDAAAIEGLETLSESEKWEFN